MAINTETTSEANNAHKPFPQFMDDIKVTMREMYRGEGGSEILTLPRGVPPTVFSKFMPHNPLSVCIPEENGGRGGKMQEIMAMVSAASYESLPLALTLGINSALFIQPVAKYARPEVKDAVFGRFLKDKEMGGLMITEPDFGSDALNMQTYCIEKEHSYHLHGKKHWAGLTGSANFWLLTARERTESGNLKRDMDFFVCDRSVPNQQIVVEEFFDNFGLHQIPYGRNSIDVDIPKVQKLVPKTTGVNLLLDLLHRSRLQFPAMGLGFVQRMLDEAIEHCNQRIVGGKSLSSYDQVQFRLARLQASYTIISAMCLYSSENGGLENDLHTSGLVPNSIKTITTDLMQDAAQSLVQLIGAKAYKYSNIGARGIADSRPFQIFEGSNDILYIQIAEAVLKLMKQAGKNNLYEYLLTNEQTNKAITSLRAALDFELNNPVSQRKLTELGQVIARIISMQIVINAAEKGFRNDLIENSLTILRKEVIGIMGAFMVKDSTLIIEDYTSNSYWFDLVK
jgi:alkylation response protein AidB-like acyl-CoA dehydrogenase